MLNEHIYRGVPIKQRQHRNNNDNTNETTDGKVAIQPEVQSPSPLLPPCTGMYYTGFILSGFSLILETPIKSDHFTFQYKKVFSDPCLLT
jgi:hypothetical protein